MKSVIGAAKPFVGVGWRHLLLLLLRGERAERRLGIACDDCGSIVSASAYVRNRVGFRSPLEACFRMRTASADRISCVRLCGGRRPHASSNTALRSASVSGSRDIVLSRIARHVWIRQRRTTLGWRVLKRSRQPLREGQKSDTGMSCARSILASISAAASGSNYKPAM